MKFIATIVNDTACPLFNEKMVATYTDYAGLLNSIVLGPGIS